MSQPRMARFAFGTTAALAALSLAAAVTQPDEAATGQAVIAMPTAASDPVPPVTTTTALLALPAATSTSLLLPPTSRPSSPPTTPPAVPTATTAAPSFASSGARESCGWSWDATHFDDGSLNEVTLVLDAPRRPNTPVTITAKPGASLVKTFATTTDENGQASMVISLSNDKRDWSLTIGAQFPGSSCDARSFTIAY